MEFITVSMDRFEALRQLHIAYKQEIHEERPAEADFARLRAAMEENRIIFYGALDRDALISCCSVCPAFSTFNYQKSGVFEDFYIVPPYRHQGVARQLVQYAWQQSGVASLTVGCADCDVEMYKALGFNISLGNMLAYDG